MIRMIPWLLKKWLSGEKTHFLVIFQNNNELRSSGGFITQAMDFQIGKGRVSGKTMDVFGELAKHKPVKAPKAIEEMLFDSHLSTWTFRDANHSPIFKETAEQLIRFYNLVYPENKVCGVMAVNFAFAEKWLSCLGEIKVRQRTIHPDGLFRFLTAETSDIDRHDLDARRERKGILRELILKMVTRSMRRFWIWPKLIGLWKKGLATKDLQLHRVDANPENDYEAKEGEDFLAIVENNYLGHKSNRYIRRTVFHDTDLGENGSSNEIRILWEHFGGDDYPLSGTYKGHIKLFLPKECDGIEMVSEPHSEYAISEEMGHKVLEFKIRMKPNEKWMTILKFKLPKKTEKESRYKFRYVKQSGVQNETLLKTIRLEGHLAFAKNTEENVRENVLFKTIGNVERDLEMEIMYGPNENPPRIYSHELIDAETLLIRFNESIMPIKMGQLEMRQKNGKKAPIEIKSVSLAENGKDLMAKLEKLPTKGRVFYTVELNNVTNGNKIPLSPNPRIVTVVFGNDSEKSG